MLLLIIRSGLGASAWDALAVGESRLFDMTVGTAVFINGMVLIGLNAIIMKKKPDILAAGTIFVIGFLIDFWLLIVFNNYAPVMLGKQIFALGSGNPDYGDRDRHLFAGKIPSKPYGYVNGSY